MEPISFSIHPFVTMRLKRAFSYSFCIKIIEVLAKLIILCAVNSLGYTGSTEDAASLIEDDLAFMS